MKTKNNDTVFICKFCNSKLKKNTGTDIYNCKCFKYPAVDGILYLIKDKKAKEAVELLENGNNIFALLKLLDLHPKLSIPVLLFSKMGLWRFLGFKISMQTLTIFGYPKSWVNYLLRRHGDLSFNLGKKCVRLLTNGSVLDFGSGVGQLLPFIRTSVGKSKIYALDNSMLSLYISKYFFSDNKTVLVCADANDGLPFATRSLENIIACDCLHDIKNKQPFIKEGVRLIRKTGKIMIIHTINASKTRFKGFFGTPEYVFRNGLRSGGFKNIFVYENSNLFEILSNSKISFRNLPKSDILKEHDFYSLLAQK